MFRYIPINVVHHDIIMDADLNWRRFHIEKEECMISVSLMSKRSQESQFIQDDGDRKRTDSRWTRI
jgi:hypothetical protein